MKGIDMRENSKQLIEVGHFITVSYIQDFLNHMTKHVVRIIRKVCPVGNITSLLEIRT